MKSIYQNQILEEKMRSNPNKGLIQRLQKYMEKGEPITKEIFFDTSTIVSAETFIKLYGGSVNLDCQIVVTFIGDFFIQSLGSGEWVLWSKGKEYRDKDPKIIEEKLWKSVQNKFK